MENANNKSKLYSNYLKNPQKHGVWCLRIDFDTENLSILKNLLNFDDLFFFRNNYSKNQLYRNIVDRDRQIPAIIVPRLFSYLRAVLTKKTQESLPDLIIDHDEFSERFVRKSIYSRFDRYRNEYSKVPNSLGDNKKKKLSKASKYYLEKLSRIQFHAVPENRNKIDCVSRYDLLYFQVVEEIPQVLKIYSPIEDFLIEMKTLFKLIPDLNLTYELTKVFSPEGLLVEMYMPIFNILPSGEVAKDQNIIKTLLLAYQEAKEGRFIHSIRALSIGTEELLVEVYESYIHEKAPEVPLGNLLNELTNNIQYILHGSKINPKFSLDSYKIEIQNILDIEKNKKRKNENFIKTLQQSLQLIPNLEYLNKTINEINDLQRKQQKINLFPSFINRCVWELVNLRNLVSYRIERRILLQSVGYQETAFAIRSLIVLANWWHDERSKIDYKLSRKDIINQTIERSKRIDD